MSSLPTYCSILRDGYTERRGSGALVRTQMEAGPAKQRRVATRTLVTRPLTMLIRGKANYLAFISWVKTDISMGADWFDWADPTDGVTKAARIVGGEYEAVSLAFDVWRISTTLETWE